VPCLLPIATRSAIRSSRLSVMRPRIQSCQLVRDEMRASGLLLFRVAAITATLALVERFESIQLLRRLNGEAAADSYRR